MVPPRGGVAEDHDVVDTQSENEKEKEDLILMKLDKNGILAIQKRWLKKSDEN